MITMLVCVFSLWVALQAVGFAMRCAGAVMRLVFGLMGVLLMPLALVFTLVFGLGKLVLPVLVVLLVAGMMNPVQA